MAKKRADAIDYETHGPRIPAVVCSHHVENTTGPSLGFVENSSEPDDLQAWCDDCERMYEREGEMTPAFRKFNDFAVVCDRCYTRIRKRHTHKN